MSMFIPNASERFSTASRSEFALWAVVDKRRERGEEGRQESAELRAYRQGLPTQ